jgi:hypothetical protein
MDLGSRYLTAETMYSDLHASYGIPLTVLTPKSQEDTVVVSPAGENKNLISSLTSVVFNKVKSQKKDTKVPVNYTRVAVIVLSILGLAGGFYVTQQMLGAQERAAQLEKEKKEAEDKKEIAEKERLIAQQKALEAENLRQTAEQQRLAIQQKQAQEERSRLAAESRQVRLERQRIENLSEQHDISQQDALHLVQKWYAAKPQIFAPPFDTGLVDQLATGKLHTFTTKANGPVEWLRQNDAYYEYNSSEIKRVLDFSTSGRRPYIKIRVSEELYLHAKNGIDENNSGASTNNFIYFFEKENGTWKIYDYRKVR